MNKLIPGALFSARAAKEQRLRARRRVDSYHAPEIVTDIRENESWDRVAEGFRKYDPDLNKLASLLQRTGT